MSQLTKLSVDNFTAFKAISFEFKSGINLFIGSNGTGKTHLLKILYAACSITDGEDIEKTFAQKIVNVFHPYEGRPGRLAYRGAGSVTASITVQRTEKALLKAKFSNHTKDVNGVRVSGEDRWKRIATASAYIPVKEMLAHAPGFLATNARRELAFEEVYSDIITRAYLPQLRGPTGETRKKVLLALQKAIDGKVVVKGEYFFLKNKQGDLEFTLLSEGMRKLALIWLLTQNGVLTTGSVLFWDEPEANLNPSRMGEVAEVMLELQRIGVQLFVSTHNYVLIKEIELRRTKDDSISYTSLYRSDDGLIQKEISANYLGLDHNKISETYNSLYDREIVRSIKDLEI